MESMRPPRRAIEPLRRGDSIVMRGLAIPAWRSSAWAVTSWPSPGAT